MESLASSPEFVYGNFDLILDEENEIAPGVQQTLEVLNTDMEGFNDIIKKPFSSLYSEGCLYERMPEMFINWGEKFSYEIALVYLRLIDIKAIHMFEELLIKGEAVTCLKRYFNWYFSIFSTQNNPPNVRRSSRLFGNSNSSSVKVS